MTNRQSRPPAVDASGDKRKYIAVEDDHAVPATLGDYFSPGGSQIVSSGPSGMDQLTVPTGMPHLPRYAPGAEDDIASLSVESLARLQIRLSKAGLISRTARVSVGVADDTTVAAYEKLLGVANRYAVSDVEALDLLESQPSLGDDGSGSTTSHSTSTSAQHFTALDAESMADQAYSEALGQASTPKQQKALKAALNAYASAHPSVTESSTTTDGEGNSTSTSSTSGGIDSAGVQQIATNQAQAAPQFGEVQAATTYFTAMQNALGATADVG